MSNTFGDVFVWVFVIAIALGILYVIRELICWYYKINDRILLQQETNRLLKEILNNQTPKTPDDGSTTNG